MYYLNIICYFIQSTLLIPLNIPYYYHLIDLILYFYPRYQLIEPLLLVTIDILNSPYLLPLLPYVLI